MQSFINSFDIEKFRAFTHFNLRHNSLSSEAWEQIIAYATNSKWVKGSADLADCVNIQDKVCISVKSRKQDPDINKRIQNRDFISHPSNYHFGGKKFSECDLDNVHTVSGRCSIPKLDEKTSSAEEIGNACLERYASFEKASLKKFKCDDTLDIVIVHGENRTRDEYLIRILFFSHTLNPIVIWKDVYHDGPRTKYKGSRKMVLGNDANGPHIARISNVGRQQTCMLRFYRKSEALKVIETTIPIPKKEKFSIDEEKKLMQNNSKSTIDLFAEQTPESDIQLSLNIT